MAYFLCLDRGISFVFVDFFSPFSSFFVCCELNKSIYEGVLSFSIS